MCLTKLRTRNGNGDDNNPKLSRRRRIINLDLYFEGNYDFNNAFEYRDLSEDTPLSLSEAHLAQSADAHG